MHPNRAMWTQMDSTEENSAEGWVNGHQERKKSQRPGIDSGSSH